MKGNNFQLSFVEQIEINIKDKKNDSLILKLLKLSLLLKKLKLSAFLDVYIALVNANK